MMKAKAIKDSRVKQVLKVSKSLLNYCQNKLRGQLWIRVWTYSKGSIFQRQQRWFLKQRIVYFLVLFQTCMIFFFPSNTKGDV